MTSIGIGHLVGVTDEPRGPWRFADVPPPPEAMPAWQNVVEFGALWNHVAARPHAVVVEIGSLFGGTLWYWSHLPAIGTLVSVDLPTSQPPLARGVRAARETWRSALSPRCDFVLVERDSHLDTTVDEVSADVDDEPIDFLFIDGDHTYDGVRRDFELWSPLVCPGGVVALHDTWKNPDGRHEPGVERFTDEMRARLPSIEWTDPDGVGIVAFAMPA